MKVCFSNEEANIVVIYLIYQESLMSFYLSPDVRSHS